MPARQSGSPRQHCIGVISASVDSIDSQIILGMIRESKSITELPSSPSSQNTVSLLLICMIKYQWQIDSGFGFLQGILFRGQNLLLCKVLLFLDQISGGGVSKGALWRKARLQTVLCDYQIL